MKIEVKHRFYGGKGWREITLEEYIESKLSQNCDGDCQCHHMQSPLAAILAVLIKKEMMSFEEISQIFGGESPYSSYEYRIDGKESWER